jgi:hypothetical protein
MKMKIILKDMDPEDFILGVRAAKYLLERFRKDAILSYGESNTKDFYAKRNKSSITVRPCEWHGS